MEIFIVVVFILGYLAITLEHNLKIDKLVPALLMMALAWAAVALGIDGFDQWFNSHDSVLMNISGEGHEERLHLMEGTLLHHFGKTCEILIFLVGAMTIVEIIDHFDGFSTIKRFIKTNKKRTLLWIVCILGFILSAIIDNLTATIVLITILRKLIDDKSARIWYAGMIIIAANAGGAWSPIGDVTTTMLWMGDKVTALKLIEFLILPSLVCMVVPTLIASFMPAFRGNFESPESDQNENKRGPLMLYIGLAMIVFVPIFKTLTHLPPYIGMMLSLSIVALVAELISARQFSMTSVDDHLEKGNHHSSPTFGALAKIEMPSILFFLGILMTVAALESLGLIFTFGQDVQASMSNNMFVMLMGGGSAVIDNVPLVAASMGMFDMNAVNEHGDLIYSTDSQIWHFIAYAAGTGGSMLIIGSAAGVVAMGMEKISFFWYLKNIAWLALIGYLAGAGVFLLF
ncbi:MAG: Na+/H+ antiporter NhaD/arsenite permease-like protein [Crocinitomicaceae bacterium]|jgi:Na+/H+ antiporter NhaD/arsenite permease-like protein